VKCESGNSMTNHIFLTLALTLTLYFRAPFFEASVGV
jgi:hypothetical protein